MDNKQKSKPQEQGSVQKQTQLTGQFTPKVNRGLIQTPKAEINKMAYKSDGANKVKAKRSSWNSITFERDDFISR